MQSISDFAEEKLIFRLPDNSLQIEFPEFIPFIFKTTRKFTEKQLYRIDEINEELRIENNANGDFEIAPRSTLEISRRNMEIIGQLGEWSFGDKTGVCFESSAKFTLPNGAKRMPDAAWILKVEIFCAAKRGTRRTIYKNRAGFCD